MLPLTLTTPPPVNSERHPPSSTAKRVKADGATTAAAAAAAVSDDSNKYRFAITSRASQVFVVVPTSAASLREMIEQLGAECIDEADDYSLCSAVVVKDNTQLKRTEKVLAAIVAGSAHTAPIVHRGQQQARPLPVAVRSYRLKLPSDAVDDTGRAVDAGSRAVAEAAAVRRLGAVDSRQQAAWEQTVARQLHDQGAKYCVQDIL